MKLTITNNSGAFISPHQKALIKNIARLTLIYEQVNPNAIIDVTIVDNDQIQTINKNHRDKDSATDVLSFPMINFEQGEQIPQKENYLLGDIVFSIEKAKSQAKDYNHSIEREMGFFIAHSMLHLLGYDHMTEDDEKRMIQKQEAILQNANLSR